MQRLHGSERQPAAVLLDIGGTLWPDRWPALPTDRARRAAALRRTLPALTPRQALRLHDALVLGTSQVSATTAPAVQALLARVLPDAGLVTLLPAGSPVHAQIRGAMCLPAQGRVLLFPAPATCLGCIHALGLRCVVVSNGTWRDAACYRRDFDAFGIGALVDTMIASAELPFCKPDPAIFAAAIAAAGCAAERCVLIGNSEENDIAPAVALGMRAIRVAIEEPPPATSAANAIVTSLAEATRVLMGWCGGGSS